MGEAGRRRSVVVVATSDAPPVERLRAAQVATAVAEHFRDLGKRVLLLVDSITTALRAKQQREIGLAAGRAAQRVAVTPPSVFTQLPRLLERSGQGETGSITAIYTVLVEGSDMDEPIADEVRGILDGHIVLDRKLAARGHYPAIDVLSSLSRVMTHVTAKPQQAAAQRARALLAAYEEKRDLIALGAYAKGSDARLDQAIAAAPDLERFLRQEPAVIEASSSTLQTLKSISDRYPERRPDIALRFARPSGRDEIFLQVGGGGREEWEARILLVGVARRLAGDLRSHRAELHGCELQNLPCPIPSSL